MGYKIKKYLIIKEESKCIYCGKKNKYLEIEHIIPKSRGGTNKISNLTIACHDCNHEKGNQTAVEFGYPEIEIENSINKKKHKKSMKKKRGKLQPKELLKKEYIKLPNNIKNISNYRR